MALRLGFDDADRPAVGVEQIISGARCEAEFAHGHPEPGRDVHLAVVLHAPTAGFELAVDLLTGLLFGGHGKRNGTLAWQCGAVGRSRFRRQAVVFGGNNTPRILR
jgi:hypothetical protein